jgi:hypothetical protein
LAYCTGFPELSSCKVPVIVFCEKAEKQQINAKNRLDKILKDLSRVEVVVICLFILFRVQKYIFYK